MDEQNRMPELPMKWHRFLISVGVWLLIVMVVLGAREVNEKNEFFAAHGLIAKDKLVLAEGVNTVGTLGFIVLTVRAFLLLRKRSRKGPGALSLALAVGSLAEFASGYFVTMANARGTEVYYLIGMVLAVLILPCRRYYNARDSYFIN